MTHKLMLAALLALLSSAPALAQDTSTAFDSRWNPYLGCWTVLKAQSGHSVPVAAGYDGVRPAIRTIRRGDYDHRRRQERARADHRRRRLGAAAVSRGLQRDPDQQLVARRRAPLHERRARHAPTGRSARSRASRFWPAGSGSTRRRRSSTALRMCACGGIGDRAMDTPARRERRRRRSASKTSSRRARRCSPRRSRPRSTKPTRDSS